MCKPTCRHNGGHLGRAGGTSHVVGAVSPPGGVHQRSGSRMHRRTRIIAQSSFALLFAVLFILSGCGSSSSGGTANKNPVIATQLPLVGTDAGVGLPPQYGVDLPVSQASPPNGYKPNLKHYNYAGANGPDTR